MRACEDGAEGLTWDIVAIGQWVCDSVFLYLKTEIDHLELRAKMTDEFAASREKAESRTRVVPEESRLDRLLRYSASLERDFDRTLSQLERLQRMRKGQPVPPTLNVNVST